MTLKQLVFKLKGLNLTDDVVRTRAAAIVMHQGYKMTESMCNQIDRYLSDYAKTADKQN